MDCFLNVILYYLYHFFLVHYTIFLATGCGRSLGMISGDIKDYQIETSSNYKDIHHSRAMQATEGWCSSPEDMERWLMVSLQ